MMFPYLAAAIIASIGYGSASVLEAMAARRARGSKIYTHPLYLTGLALDGLSWLASLIALQQLTLFTVQALLSGSLIITILLARWVFSVRLKASALWAMGLMVLGLILLALSTGPQQAAAPPANFTVLLVAAVLIVGAGVVLGYRRFAPMGLSFFAGLAASIAALAARGLQLPVDWWMVIGEPLMWVVLMSAVIAMAAYTRALESGSVGPVTAVFTAIEVLIPGLIGMMVFGDAPRPGWEVCKVLALALSLAAGLWLAWQPGADPEAASEQDSNDNQKVVGG